MWLTRLVKFAIYNVEMLLTVLRSIVGINALGFIFLAIVKTASDTKSMQQKLLAV